jgi:hypothetical protein
VQTRFTREIPHPPCFSCFSVETEVGSHVHRHGVVQPEPEDILDLRSHKVNSCTVVEVLVQWNGQKKGGSIMGGFSSSKVYLLIPYGQGVLNEWGSGIGMRKRKSELFKKGSIESKGVKEALQGLIPEELRKVKV